MSGEVIGSTAALPAATDGASEQLASAAQNIVQRFLKMRRALGDVASDLLHVLFVALLDVFPEQLTQRTVAQSFFALLRMVGHQIRHERASEATGALARVGVQERID